MFGLEFSLSTASVMRLASVMKEYNVNMISTSVGTLSVWREWKGRDVEHYPMGDILPDPRVLEALPKESHHQLEDFVRAILEVAQEIKENKLK